MDELNELIKKSIANHRPSQEKLYRQFYPSLFCLGKKFFKDDHAALEVVNDGMLKVFKHLPDYKTGQGAFFNWVYTIVRNTALDRLKLTVHIAIGEINDWDEPDKAINVLQQLEWKDIYQYLDHLPAATRMVFSLFYLEGFTIPQITERLSVSTGTVKWHLNAGRKIMLPILKKHFIH